MDEPTVGEPYRSPSAIIALTNGNKYWCHVDGACRLVVGSHSPEGRAAEYAWFGAGWMRVTVTNICIYIEGGDLADIDVVVQRNHWYRADREIRVDVTPYPQPPQGKTQKFDFRNGVWIRERSRGRPPEVIRFR